MIQFLKSNIRTEIEELELRVDQLKAQLKTGTVVAELSPEELLQAALAAPCIARCRAMWDCKIICSKFC